MLHAKNYNFILIAVETGNLESGCQHDVILVKDLHFQAVACYLLLVSLHRRGGGGGQRALWGLIDENSNAIYECPNPLFVKFFQM